MEIKDCINVTLKKNEVIIKIDVTADHKKVMANLKKKIPELKKLYKEDKTPILIKGKILSTKEKKEIKTLIQDAIDVEVRFEGAKALGLYGIQETYCREISTSETKFHRGSLRSGQRLEFEGSIVILGDVNGTLRGLAHAGANGNKSAIIAANSIETLQIRIANIVKEIERDEVDILKTYAYIEKDDKITME